MIQQKLSCLMVASFYQNGMFRFYCDFIAATQQILSSASSVCLFSDKASDQSQAMLENGLGPMVTF